MNVFGRHAPRATKPVAEVDYRRKQGDFLLKALREGWRKTINLATDLAAID